MEIKYTRDDGKDEYFYTQRYPGELFLFNVLSDNEGQGWALDREDAAKLLEELQEFLAE